MKTQSNPCLNLLTASLLPLLSHAAMATDILWPGTTTGFDAVDVTGLGSDLAIDSAAALQISQCPPTRLGILHDLLPFRWLYLYRQHLALIPGPEASDLLAAGLLGAGPLKWLGEQSGAIDAGFSDAIRQNEPLPHAVNFEGWQVTGVNLEFHESVTSRVIFPSPCALNPARR